MEQHKALHAAHDPRREAPRIEPAALPPSPHRGLAHAPVDEAVGELLEELVGGVLRAQHKLAHGQRFGRRRRHHVAQRGVDEHLGGGRRRRRVRGSSEV